MPSDIARRSVLSTLGGAALWPLAARAQSSGKAPRVGVLPTGYRQTDPEGQARINALGESLGKLGWSDGRNVSLEVRWPGGDANQISADTAALVQSAPDLIVISSNAALTALLKLDTRIPTVFVQISDPLGGGFVKSLSRPEGNVTGFQNFEPAVGGKWLGLLKEVAPDLTRAAVTVYPDTAVHSEFMRAIEAVAPSLGIEASAIAVREADDLARGIAGFAGTPNGGLIVLPPPRN